MLCVECKWKDLTKNESIVILEKLEEKSRLIRWRNEKRKTICALIGRKIAGKDEICKAGYEVYDLADIN
jgi:hypothetical protein